MRACVASARAVLRLRSHVFDCPGKQLLLSRFRGMRAIKEDA